MDVYDGLVVVDDDEESRWREQHPAAEVAYQGKPAPAIAGRVANFTRNMETLRELQADYAARGEPLDPQDVAALQLAVVFLEIDLYAAASPPPYKYNVWDYARRERVEVREWLARQEVGA